MEREISLDGQGFMCELTSRELEICEMIAKGFSSKQIAKLLFLSEGTIKNHVTAIYEKTGIKNRAQLVANYVAGYNHVLTDVSGPSFDEKISARANAALRRVGLAGLPDIIPLVLTVGRPFVIGRFDVAIGQRRCDFEFGKATKGVSRRHASMERTARGTVLTDLHSSAGTFVNGNRIPQGESLLVEHGDRLAFGNAGADYVFEDCYHT